VVSPSPLSTLYFRFDPHFNAITGLNGSGKSNILDAICFVLGTNLSQVRAGNLSELVYKQGQAGVNKATVTIVLTMRTRLGVPLDTSSFRDYRCQVLEERANTSSTVATVPWTSPEPLSLVQLNVTNPHFLIMQGRITRYSI
jgi:structural maintenance of chromosome 2